MAKRSVWQKSLQVVLCSLISGFFLLVSWGISESAMVRLEKGKREISISGLITFDPTVIDMSMRWGYFCARNHEVEIALSYLGFSKFRSLDGEIGYSLNLPNFMGEVVPFFPVGGGFANFLELEPHLLVSLGGGVKIFVSSDVAIRIEHRYRKFFGVEPRRNTNEVTFGISGLF